MQLFEEFDSAHENIQKRTGELHSEEIAVCILGIDTLLQIKKTLSGLVYDYSTKENAVRTILWRYVVSMPSTAYVCLETGLMGQYPTSYNILRLLIEEMISVKYYLENPKLAKEEIEEAVNSGIVRKPRIRTKFAKIKKKNPSLQKLYAKISEVNSHANSLQYMGKLINEPGGELLAPKEPRYNEEMIKFIFVAIVRLLYMALEGFSRAFPELENSRDYNEVASAFSVNAKKMILE